MGFKKIRQPDEELIELMKSFDSVEEYNSWRAAQLEDNKFKHIMEVWVSDIGTITVLYKADLAAINLIEVGFEK